ncbi:MAG TPA: hypothetical protein VLH38_02035 [Patescibacteria group bacterium]|nr:hypothetical protein [Patescibacteria group bacterium]
MYRIRLPHLQLNHQQRNWTISVASLAVCILLFAQAMPAIERRLDAWQLLPQKQNLIELSLDDPQQLSKTYHPGAGQTVSFTVANHAPNKHAYGYTVTESDPSSKRTTVLATDSVQVGAYDSRTIIAAITPIDLGKRVFIRVALSNNITVGYWVER